jgi:lipopolysaccharide biosynthesis glycosyltransferase
MIDYAFLTVTDYDFFPGTLATISSIREFQPDAKVIIVESEKSPLSLVQRECLHRSQNVSLMPSSLFAIEGRHMSAYELKAYAACDLCEQFDVLIGIDSDCILCSSIIPEIEKCYNTGAFMGGKDGGLHIHSDGITSQTSEKYISTSLYLVKNNDKNRQTLKKWAKCCNQAVFSKRGSYPGHIDQIILNAVLFVEDNSQRVSLLENRLWSQHWTYWDSVIDYQDGEFINLSFKSQKQRSFHSWGNKKFWQKEHRNKILSINPSQLAPYVWFLAMFWFGPCRRWDIDPVEYIPQNNRHLIEDLLLFLPQIMTVYPSARNEWDQLPDKIISNRLVSCRCITERSHVESLSK